MHIIDTADMMIDYSEMGFSSIVHYTRSISEESLRAKLVSALGADSRKQHHNPVCVGLSLLSASEESDHNVRYVLLISRGEDEEFGRVFTIRLAARLALALRQDCKCNQVISHAEMVLLYVGDRSTEAADHISPPLQSTSAIGQTDLAAADIYHPNSSHEEASELYERLAELPTVQATEIVDDGATIKLTLAYKDHTTLSKHTKLTSIAVDPSRPSKPPVVSPPQPVDPCIKAEAGIKGSATLRVTLRETATETSSSNQSNRRFVEIQSNGTRLVSVEVTKASGQFLTDETFGSLSALQKGDARWRVLFEAAALPPKDLDERDPLQQFAFTSSLGEKYSKKLRPALFLLDIGTDEAEITEIKSTQELRVYGQATFVDDCRLVCTAYDPVAGERRLGQVYCTNRPASVHIIEVIPARAKGEAASKRRLTVSESQEAKPTTLQLSSASRSARSPRIVSTVSKQRHDVIWLETPLGGPHSNSSAIMKASFGDHHDEASPSEIVPLDYQDGNDSSVQGLYVDQLPKSPFMGSDLFGLTTIQGCRKVVILFNLSGSTLSRLADGTDNWTFLEGHGKTALLQQSSLTAPPKIQLFSSYELKLEKPQKVWQLDTGLDLSHLKTSVLTVPGTIDQRSKDDSDVEVIFVSSAQGPTRNRPCIFSPHGGPHSAVTTDWAPGTLALALLGYSFIFPNYHGSLGRSPSFVSSLIGRCGELDVQDCVRTIRHFIDKDLVDADRIWYSGGSHGGFLGTWLAAHPEEAVRKLWKGVILRNPVTHIGEMWATTDIRDWCLSEVVAGSGDPQQGSYNFSNPPTYLSSEHFSALSAASPLPHTHRITSPLLLLLGDADQRVPHEQGVALYHALREKWQNSGDEGRKMVECLMFPGADHSLDNTVEASFNSWKAGWRFLSRTQ